jgi:hypothetical protein
MDEHELRSALIAQAEYGVPSDSVPAIDILARVAGTRTGRWWRSHRLRLALAGAGIGVALATTGVLAASWGTFPIRFNLVGVPPARETAAPGKTAPATDNAADPTKGGSAATKTAAPGASPAGVKIGDPSTAMSLPDAEAAFGTHVLVATDSGATLDGVFFTPATPAPVQSKPGAPPDRDAVTLDYRLAGTQVIVTEQRDPTTTPLTVEALDQGGPVLKTEGGLGPASIETVDGGSYVIGRSVDGRSVVWVIWKSTAGVDVAVHFDQGIGHDGAIAFATGMR